MNVHSYISHARHRLHADTAPPHPRCRRRQARGDPAGPPRRCSPATASSSRRSPTSPAPPASRPARSTSTSAARTTCSSRSSSARCARRLPKDAPRSSGVDDPRERLTRIARLHLERLGRDRDLAVVFQVELRQSTKFMERFSSTYLRDYLGLIRETIADGQAAGPSAATSTRRSPPRCSSARSTKWPPTGC